MLTPTLGYNYESGKHTMTDDTILTLSKVPEVTLGFWIIKVTVSPPVSPPYSGWPSS